MLFDQYQKEIIPALQKKLSIKNPWDLPRLVKVVINVRVPEGTENRRAVDSVIEEVKLITGQKPRVCRAKQSIAGFKLRQGDPIGLKVTLRKAKMYHFLERLFALALPRLRDFRGLSVKKFDRGGNFNLSLKEQIIFPEIDMDKSGVVRGLQVTIVTRAKNIEQSKLLLEALGLPLKKEEDGV